jgi:uncharacterized protein YuzE
MKFNYDKDTDALYISFNDSAGVDSYELSPDFIADVDETGNLIGIEVLNVMDKIDFQQIIFNQLPIKDIRFLNQSVAN